MRRGQLMRVVMYPLIKIVGDFDPRYTHLVERTSDPYIKPGSVYIESAGGLLYVFKKTKDGRIRRGHYKSMIDAVYAAHCKR